MKSALPSPDDPISPEEAAAAEELRGALEAGSLEHDGASLLASLAASHAPRPLDADVHAKLVTDALAKASRAPGRRGLRQGGVVIRVAFGASTLVAAAAAIVISLRPAAPSPEAPFVARSTQSLFDDKFTLGGTTARVDRIAAVRAAEFRDNQFARWGVR